MEEKRAEASAEGAELKAAQKAGDLEAWKKLRAEGKVTVSDQERARGGTRDARRGLSACMHGQIKLFLRQKYH